MGGKTPETCWAIHKRQVINLWNCCILLVNLFELFEWNYLFGHSYETGTKFYDFLVVATEREITENSWNPKQIFNLSCHLQRTWLAVRRVSQPGKGRKLNFSIRPQVAVPPAAILGFVMVFGIGLQYRTRQFCERVGGRGGGALVLPLYWGEAGGDGCGEGKSREVGAEDE
jgi:hypothetical protein